MIHKLHIHRNYFIQFSDSSSNTFDQCKIAKIVHLYICTKTFLASLLLFALNIDRSNDKHEHLLIIWNILRESKHTHTVTSEHTEHLTLVLSNIHSPKLISLAWNSWTMNARLPETSPGDEAVRPMLVSRWSMLGTGWDWTMLSCSTVVWHKQRERLQFISHLHEAKRTFSAVLSSVCMSFFKQTNVDLKQMKNTVCKDYLWAVAASTTMQTMQMLGALVGL